MGAFLTWFAGLMALFASALAEVPHQPGVPDHAEVPHREDVPQIAAFSDRKGQGAAERAGSADGPAGAPGPTDKLTDRHADGHADSLADGHLEWRADNGALTDYRPIIATLAGVIALLVMILARQMPAFPALLVAALLTGLAAGLAPDRIIAAIQTGMGGVLGFIAVIVGLGALLSAFLEAGGGAQAMARLLVAGRSRNTTITGMGFVGLIIAIPVFFDVGLILLVPLVRALARRFTALPILFGLPLLAGLATAHAFIPPTPGPIAVAEILNADLGWVIVFGLAAGLPAMLIAGPVYTRLAERTGLMAGLQEGHTDNPPAELQSMASSREAPHGDRGLAVRALACIFVPLALIVLGTLASAGRAGNQGDLIDLGAMMAFVGHPFVALLIACGLGAVLLRPRDAAARLRVREAVTKAFEPTAAILLVTGAGGAFKQILIDTGAGEQMAQGATALGLGPLVAGFLLAALVRIAQGSATVAMLTAAGLAAPMASAAGLGAADLALMTISIAAGASILSHVNDSGFWLVAKYFDLTTADALKTWTVSSTLVGTTGFVIALIISFFV